MIFGSIAARIAAAVAFVLVASAAALGQSGTAVLTYHNNYQRWGWNAQETILTPSALSSTSSKFGVIATVNVDDVMDAQPLVVPQIPISCPASQTIVACNIGAQGVHDIVYVVTMQNSVYAIDAKTGTFLLHRQFGPPANCGGIRGTPVIDPVKGILYLIAHVNNNGTPTFTLYALDVKTLTDVVAPYTITGANTSEPLTNGVTFGFDGSQACQRPGLLLLNGKIYAAFSGLESTTGSGPTRGWLLGWNASDLTPLAPLLTDQEATAANSFFLTSIWMSGAGVASDGTNLYFVTGNSDPSGLSYDPVKNIEESTVKVTPDLKVSSVFTPYNYATLDKNDFDFGSGGVMILPGTPPYAVVAGKDGRMFLLNGDSLGGYTPGGPDNVVDMHRIGPCWCAPSLFANANGYHVVSSGGSNLISWTVVPGTATTNPKLVKAGQAQLPVSFQDGGFFTSVSSNGAKSAVIWALGRPTDKTTGALTLYAYNGVASQGILTLLGQYPAGTWNPNYERNLNSVPVVANGKVYVSSGDGLKPSGTLTILGLVP